MRSRATAGFVEGHVFGPQHERSQSAGDELSIRLKALVCISVTTLLLGSETWHPANPAAPLVGFSFSPLTSE